MNEMRTTSRKTRVGKVVSDKMDKTIVVIVEDPVAHKITDGKKARICKKCGAEL